MEFILKVENEPFVKGGKKLYKSTAFESLVFDQKGLDKLEKYDRARCEAEKHELTKLRGQVDDLCDEVNRLTNLEYKSCGIGFQEGYDTGLKKLHDALKIVSTMTLDERMDTFGTSSISDVLNHYDPFRIIDVVTEFNSNKENEDDGYKLWHQVEGDFTGTKAIIYHVSDDTVSVLYWDPTHTKLVAYDWLKSVCTPTGKVYSDLLEFIENTDEESN